MASLFPEPGWHVIGRDEYFMKRFISPSRNVYGSQLATAKRLLVFLASRGQKRYATGWTWAIQEA
jgi:hypothetical protein